MNKKKNNVILPCGLKISVGNSKMGEIPSVSLTPGRTCAAGSPCLKGCYALKLARLYPNVKSNWDNNTDVVRTSDRWWLELSAWIKEHNPRAFRIHVAGDFFSEDYLRQWVWIAKACPKTKFFGFTKQFDVLRRYIACSVHNLDSRGRVSWEYPRFPKNFNIILSAWTRTMPDGQTIPVPPPVKLMNKGFPVAWVAAKKGNVYPSVVFPERSYTLCGGNCESCHLCESKKMTDVIFNKH